MILLAGTLFLDTGCENSLAPSEESLKVNNHSLLKHDLKKLNVFITGPSFVGYKEFGTWMANVSGGMPSYNYQWYVKFDGSTYWWPKGTSQTQTLRMGSIGFTLKVVVTDNSNQTTEDTHYVSNEIDP